MLTKTTLRALSPGQWARVRVPDYECWQKTDGYRRSTPGDEVDICVMPSYAAAVRVPDALPLDTITSLIAAQARCTPNYESPEAAGSAPGTSA